MKRGGVPMTTSSGKGPKTYDDGRVCGHPDCATRLSRYNAEQHCFVHATTLIKGR